MNKDLTFFIDLDGTLKTDVETPAEVFETQTFVLKAPTKSYRFCVRPYYMEMLDLAKDKGRLCLSTAAGRGYAEKVCALMGINDMFDEMYCADNFIRGIPAFANCVFIDNDHDMGMIKMGKMPALSLDSVVRQDLWTVETFTGSADDRELLEVMSAIKELK